MREILFRGKRIDNGEWVEGYYAHIYANPNRDVIITGRLLIYSDGATNSENYQVDPETVGQYTGLTDCNDKKIFEGDIVQTRTGEIYEFAFIERYSRFALKRPGTVFGWSNPKLCKVIGNIHDNPELMEGNNDTA